MGFLIEEGKLATEEYIFEFFLHSLMLLSTPVDIWNWPYELVRGTCVFLVHSLLCKRIKENYTDKRHSLTFEQAEAYDTPSQTLYSKGLLFRACQDIRRHLNNETCGIFFMCR